MSSAILFSEITPEGKKIGNYLLIKSIGAGQFGQVFLANHIETNKMFAVKQIKKDRINSNALLTRLLHTEINIMHEIKHPNILHLYEFLHTANNYYLVLDYCNQGNFYSYVKARNMNKFSETEAVYMLKQIANGFQELRKRKILHRDFKLDNLFFNDNKLVIGDFGFAKSGVEMATTILGSPVTMAYEILTADTNGVTYSSKADLWSIGVVYYEILFGVPPFDGRDIEELVSDIRNKTKNGLPFLTKVSAESQHLITQLLKTNPEERLSWLEFFNHPLFDMYPENIRPSFHNISTINDEKILTAQDMNQEFQRNRLDAKVLDNVDFLDHEGLMDSAKKFQIEPQMVEETPIDELTKSKVNLQLVFKEINYIYNHERNRLLFITYSIRNIQKYLKEDEFMFASTELYALCFHLLQMALIICRNIINNLEQKINVHCFDLAFFNIFINSAKYQAVLNSFHEDLNKLTNYKQILLKRTKKQNIKLKLDHLETMADNQLYNDTVVSYEHLKKHINNNELANQKKLHKYLLMMASVKYSIENQTSFSYVKQISYAELRFNWDDFYEFQQKMTNYDLLGFI